MTLHKDITLGDNHIIHNYTYASAAARTAATGFVTADSGKVARQTDTNTFWVLTTDGTTHVWQQLGAGTDTTGTADLNFNDFTINQVTLKDYAETGTTPTISAGTLTLNITNGNTFSVAHSSNITTLSITNPSAAGLTCSVLLILTQDATGGRTITFPASVKWSGGTAPTLTTTANKINILSFFTIDAGTTWFGALVGKDY